jgi:hypothetical protein
MCAGSAASSPANSGSGSNSAGGQVVADGPLSCFVMKRADFERLLGPYEELWRYEALRKVSSAVGLRVTCCRQWTVSDLMRRTDGRNF